MLTRYYRSIFVVLSLLGLGWMGSIAAVELAGVKLEENVQLKDGTPLKLNGAGIRTKVFFKLYVAALYLRSPQSEANLILSSATEPRQIDLHLLRELSADQLWNATADGIKANATEVEWLENQPSLQQLRGIYQKIAATRPGDRIQITFLPNQGTEIFYNGASQGVIAADKFNPLLLSVWLGNKPVQSDLKAALLGKI